MIKISREQDENGYWWRVAIDFSADDHEPVIAEFHHFALAVDFIRDWQKDHL